MRKIPIARLNGLIRELNKKDNLTDLVQAIPQSKPVSSGNDGQSSSKPLQQVVAGNGEIITLGNKPSKKS